ncbi:MAG: hypothetical protein Q9174_002620 [Haloplaca sp. 1 TL-2023]
MNTLGAANHYHVLELKFDQVETCGISHDEIKRAYRLALLANHPDKQHEYNLAQAKPARYSVDEVTTAYNTLIDPVRRLQYDKQLKHALREKYNNASKVYADWCGPCKAIGPIYEQLSAQLSRPQQITFAKVDTERLKEVAQTYKVTSLPTFIIFKNRQIVSTVQGADPRRLSEAVNKLAAEASADSSGGFGEAIGSGSGWIGTGLPKGYDDVTDQVDVRGVDILNSDSHLGNARTLFDGSKPSVLVNEKGKKQQSNDSIKKDWVESDTDEQLILFIPFQSTLKVHTLHLTSLPQQEPGPEADDIPMRPKTIQVYTNRAHVLGFEEAEDIQATQSTVLQQHDWNTATGTAKIELRYVKFQNVSSLVLFVQDGDGEGEKVRIDRLRIIGERGEKRELGKLEKISDQAGE